MYVASSQQQGAMRSSLEPVGAGEAHTNMAPYISVNFLKCTDIYGCDDAKRRVVVINGQ